MAGSKSQWADALKDVYAERASDPALSARYSALLPVNQCIRQERERVLCALLRAHLKTPVADARVVEVGCGHGGNLLDFVKLGFDPAHLLGNDLIDSRVEQARRSLPAAVTVQGGNALELDIAPGSMDIVFQSTVFTSLLDAQVRTDLATLMWRWTRPGGAVLWYDFAYNNPKNPHVRGMPLKEVRALFPEARIDVRRLTLAPPLARRLPAALYGPVNTLMPLLRTHLFCWIEKPA